MPRFRADCSNCCGLCCVVPDLLAVQGFRVDKPAEMPCIHLDALQRCAIHASRDLHGYRACQGFDCYGAGQWITQTLFAGATWTNSPQLARQMFDAYRYWGPRFEAAALLEAALAHIGIESRGPIVEKMNSLISPASAPESIPTDAAQLRRETIALIRGALRSNSP